MASNNNNLPVFPRIFTIVLAKGVPYTVEVGQASSLFLYANTGNSGTLAVTFENQQQFPMIVGQIVKSNVPFTRVTFQNNDTGSVTFTFVVSNGDIDFKGAISVGTQTVVPSQNAAGTYAADVATGAAAKVFTGISNLCIILTADPSNTDSVYIGFDNGVAANKKVLALTPGQNYTFNNYKGDLWAFSTVAQKLSVSSM
jgi:hypothetical protein